MKNITSMSLVLVLAVCLQVAFLLSEGKTAKADVTSSITVNLDVLSTGSVTSPGNPDFGPPIQESGIANGNATWNIKSNSSNGWEFSVNATTKPAMKSGSNSFADYSPANSDTPDAWSVSSADSEFGFNPSGSFIESRFSGSKYLGFDGTNQILAAHSNAPSGGTGDDVTMNFRAQVGTNHVQPQGTYSATITASVVFL